MAYYKKLLQETDTTKIIEKPLNVNQILEAIGVGPESEVLDKPANWFRG